MNNPVAWCLAYLFNKYLSGTLKELSTEQVLVSLLKGDIKLGDLELSGKKFHESQIELSRGKIGLFRLSIPWHKVLLGDSCVILLEISNVHLEFKRLIGHKDQTEDEEELKARILKAFEEKIRSRRSNFNRLLEVLSTKLLSIEVIEFILSRLEIQISGIHITIKSIVEKKNSSLEFNISNLSIIPTDNEFQNFPDKSTSLWEKLQGFGTIAMQRPTVTLSESLLQFKIINVKDVSINLITHVKENLMFVKTIEAFYSSKNYLWIGQSEKDTFIQLKASVSEIKFVLNNENISEIYSIVEPKVQRPKRSGKEIWARAKSLVIRKVRMRSWLYITRKILWKSVYKKLYAKHILGIEPELSSSKDVSEPVLTQLTQNEGLGKYLKLFIPQIEYNSKESKVKPKSKIIPSFHFNVTCPVEELELALLDDLEKNLEISEIVKYRQEEQDRYDYEQFEKSMKKSNLLNSGMGKISNYFKAKGKILIHKSDDSKVVNLNINAVLDKIDIRLKAVNKFYLDIFLYQILIDEECVFTEPLFRYKQTNYDRKSLTSFRLEKVEIFDLLVCDCKMIKKVFEINSGTSIELVHNLKHFYSGGFTQSVTQKLTVHLPELFVFLIPNFYSGFEKYFSKIFEEVPNEHIREDYLMELLEPLQDYGLNYKHEKPLIVNFNITKLDLFIANTYITSDPVLKFAVGGLNFMSSSNKLQLDIKFIEASSAALNKYETIPGLFLYNIFKTQGLKIISCDKKTEVLIKAIQSDISNEEILNIFKIAIKWSEFLVKSDYPTQIFKVSLKSRWIKLTLQKMLSSFMVSINTIVSNIYTVQNTLQVIIKSFVYSNATFLLETDTCISAREITVTTNNSSEILLHLYSAEKPKIILNLPGKNILYRDTQAAFFFLIQSIDKINEKYKNISCTNEFTFSNFHLGIDLKLLDWILNLKNSLSYPDTNQPFEYNSIIKSKSVFHGTNFSVVFMNGEKANYFLACEKMCVVIDNYPNKSETRVRLFNPHLIDVSFESSLQNLIISPIEESLLDINFLTRERKSGKICESKTEIRFNNSKLVYLNRVIMEAYEYFYCKLMQVFSSPTKSDVKYTGSTSILILDSELFLPRNSVSEGGFTIKFECFEMSNLETSPFLDTKMFKFELVKENVGPEAKVMSMHSVSQEQFRKKSKFFSVDGHSYSKDIQEVNYINPEAIRQEQGYELDGFEIYFYDPDKEIYSRDNISYKSPILTEPREEMIESSKYLKVSGNFNKYRKNLSFNSQNSQHSIYRDTPKLPENSQDKHSLYSEESETDTEEDFVLSSCTYKIKLNNCNLLDYYSNLITTEKFTLHFEISTTSTPMRILIIEKSESKKFQLEMFQDQYHILLKTLQENFFEINSCEPSNAEQLDQIWLELKIQLNNLHLSLINDILMSSYLYRTLPRSKELCEFVFNNFCVEVYMWDTGKKKINIESDNFQIFDKRIRSLMIFEDTPPLAYMHNSDFEYAENNVSSDKTSFLNEAKLIFKRKTSIRFIQPNDEDNKFRVKIKLNGPKNINVKFSYAIFIVLPDFFTDIGTFFQSPYNTDLFPEPDTVKFIIDPEPQGMNFSLNLSEIRVLLLSSLKKSDSTCFLFRFRELSTEISWKGDCNIGPGTMNVNLNLNLEGTHLVPFKYGLSFYDFKFFESVIEPYILKIDYLFLKPIKGADWATTQVNIRSSKEQDLKFNLNLSNIPIIKKIVNKLGEPSISQDKRERFGSDDTVIRKVVSNTESKDQISINLAIYGLYCKLFNDQMQPIFQASMKEILSAYQEDRTAKNCEANFIVILQVDYFNQKLMAWEPMIEEWGLEIQYSKGDDFSLIEISEYNNILHVNLSTALISTLSNIWPILSNLSTSSQNSEPADEPYVFENLTGLPIKLQIMQKGWTRNIEKEVFADQRISITLNELNELNTELNPKHLTYEKKTLSIDINPNDSSSWNRVFSQLKFRKVTHIGIDTPDTYFIYLENYNDRHEDNPKIEKNKSKKIDLRLGRLSRKFISEEDVNNFMDSNPADDDNCLNFIKRRPFYNKRLAKGKAFKTIEKENSSKISFIVDVQWNQESSQRVITIRSSISIINSLPCKMNIGFIHTDENEDNLKYLTLESNNKVPVPLLICNKGELRIKPSENFEYCKIIRRVNNPLDLNGVLNISCVDGIFDKELYTRVSYMDKGDIELGFIPLMCKATGFDAKPFYFALTVKKIPNANPVRRIEQAKDSESVQKKNGLIGFKKKAENKNIREFEKEKIDEKLDAEFQLDSTSDETMIIITSIASFTNALSHVCKFSIWTGDKTIRPPISSELKQGQTEHLYYLDFFEDSYNLVLSIKGYEESSIVEIFPLGIEKEKKYCIELHKMNKKHKENGNIKASSLFLWVRIIEDESRCWRISVYSPYWIINKTHLNLRYSEPRIFRKKKYSNENESDESCSEFNSIEEGSNLNDNEEFKLKKIKTTVTRKKQYRFTNEIKRKYTNCSTPGENKVIDEKNWKLISLFSTSKIINKLNVAVKLDKGISKWSQNFSLTNSGTSGELRIDGQDGAQYDLGVTIEKGQGVFQQTNVITFRPLYLLKNNYQRELSVRQLEVDKRKACWNLLPGKETSVFWYSCKGDITLSVAVNLGEGRESNKKWSGGFSISEVGEFIIKLPLSHIDGREEDLFLQVSIISCDPMIIVQFTENKTRVPYELINYTSHEIQFHQLLSVKSNLQVRDLILKPCSSDEPTRLKYTWDEECSPHTLVVNIGTIKKEIEFDKFQKFAPIKIDEEIWIENVLKNKKREGKIRLKMNTWVKEQVAIVVLTEKWLIVEREKKKKAINLDTHCTKVVYIDNNTFDLQTCTKSIQFRSNNSDEILDWYELIDQAVRHKGRNTQLYVNITVELKGVTHVMKFENEDSTKNEKHHQKCKRAIRDGEALEDTDNIKTKFIFKVDISEIGFSLIDNAPQERIYLYLTEFDLAYSKYENNTFGVNFSVTELKIDNQHTNSHIPVILNPYFNSKSAQQKTVIFHIIAERMEELDNINFLKFMIAPLEIKLDEQIISNLIEYYTFIQKTFQLTKESPGLDNAVEPKDDEFDGMEVLAVYRDPSATSMLELVCAQLGSNQRKDLIIEKRVYIHKLVLGPLEFCVTLDKNNIDSTRNKKSNLIQILADLGLALTSIESTELKLAGYKIEKLLQPRSQFIMSMINHYRSQGIRELYKIVGSVELLGNPFALINSLKAGVKEMFYDPAVALIESPNKFGESLLKGSLGLVRHTVHGLFKSVGTLTGGIGRFLTALTLDKKFQTKMRVLKSRRAHNFGDKLKIGFKTISYGFVQGITGLVTSPIEGIKQGGFGGLLKGIGKGIIGTVAKPTAGIVGTVSDAFSGIGNFAKKKHQVKNIDRSRYPRSFESDRILRPYDKVSSKGQYFLAKYLKSMTYEKIYLYLKITFKKKQRVLIMTNKSIYVIRKTDFHGLAIPKRAIKGAVLENHIIAVTTEIDSPDVDENLKEFRLGNKKRLLKDLCIVYEDDPKSINNAIFNVSLRGLGQIQQEGELSKMLNSYVSST